MYIYSGQPVNLLSPLQIDDTNYPPGWFLDAAARQAAGILEVADPVPPEHSDLQSLTLLGFEWDGSTWRPQWRIADKTPEQLAQEAEDLKEAKAAKNAQIDAWRTAANQSTFDYAGLPVACDLLSRSDIDGVAINICLMGDFPEGFPGGWKAKDAAKTVIPLPTLDDFRAMYAAMTKQSTANFNHSQALKVQLDNAQTLQAVEAISW